MKNFRYMLLLLLPPFFFFAACADESPEKLLIGSWETAERTHEAFHSTLEFYSDGKVFMGNKLKLDYEFTFDGKNELVIKQPDTSLIYPLVETIFVTIKGDTMIQKKKMHEQMTDIIWTRTENTGGIIYGTWQRNVLAGIPGFITFYKDGTAKYRIYSNKKEGTYLFTENGVTMVFKGTTFHDQPFTVTENELIMHSYKPGQETLYLRAND